MKKRIKQIITFQCLLFCFSSLQAEKGILLNTKIISSIPFQNDENIEIFSKLKPSLGASLGMEIRPFYLIGFTLDGNYSFFSQESKNNSLLGINLFDGNLGFKINYPVLDFLTLTASSSGGVYYLHHTKNPLNSNNIEDKKNDQTFKYLGVNYTLNAGTEIRLRPWLNASITAGYKNYLSQNSNLLSGVNISAGFSFNLSELFNSKPKIKAELSNIDPVFPVLYSWYNDNSFGSVNIYNGEDTKLTDIKVYFYCEQYMSQAKFLEEISFLNKNETISVSLSAFFNESTLKLLEKTNANSVVILEYKKLGQNLRTEIPVILPIYHRNSMSWEDDRRAAVFVSPNDVEAKSFAMQTASVVRNNLLNEKNANLQYACALFEALNLYGMNYVIDPTSAYADNVGSSSIDFLQFPFQSLNYRGGDCDDLSILYCSLLESLGIESAFITVPGHIYCAFNTGLSYEEAKESFKTDILIEAEGNGWIPVEITMIKDGFNAAVRFGMTEWKKAESIDAACIYPMHTSWLVYRTVTAPGADADIYVPARQDILAAFNKQIKLNY